MDPSPNDVERDASARAMVVAAKAPLELAGQPGRFRISTKIGAAVTALSIGTAIVTGGSVMALAIIAANLGVVWTGFLGVKDLMVPSARKRRTSDQALDVYFKGVQKGNWAAAFATLAPVAREQVVTIPHVEELKTVARTMRRSTPKDLEAYWEGMAKTEFSMMRQIERYTVTPIEIEENLRRNRIEMWIRYQGLSSFGPSHYRTAFDVTTVKHKSQWWVLDGEFKPPIRVAGSPRAKLPAARVVSGLD